MMCTRPWTVLQQTLLGQGHCSQRPFICGCALNSITTKPSPKSLGFLCRLCDGDPDQLPVP